MCICVCACVWPERDQKEDHKRERRDGGGQKQRDYNGTHATWETEGEKGESSGWGGEKREQEGEENGGGVGEDH